MPTLPLSYQYDDAVRAWHREFPILDLDIFLLAALVVRIGRIVEGDMSSLCQKNFGISGPDAGLLFALRRLGSPYSARPRDLTPMLLISSGAVTKQIDRLTTLGLVVRSADPKSRNGQLVALTPAGLELVDRATTLLATESIMVAAQENFSSASLQSGTTFCRDLVVTLENLAKGGPQRKPNGGTPKRVPRSAGA